MCFDSPEEMIEGGTRLPDLFVNPEDWERMIGALTEKEILKGAVASLRMKNGSEVWLEFTLNLMREDDGRITGYEGVFEDITMRVEADRRTLELAYKLNGLTPGGCFFNGSHERCFKAYKDLTLHGIPGLCIVREDPQKLEDDYKISAAEVQFLGSRAPRGGQALSNLQAVSLAISKFLEAHHAPIILLDGLEYLVNRFGFDLVLQMLQEKRIDILEADGVLILPINPGAFSEREIALLKSELKMLQ